MFITETIYIILCAVVSIYGLKFFVTGNFKLNLIGFFRILAYKTTFLFLLRSTPNQLTKLFFFQSEFLKYLLFVENYFFYT